MTTDPERFKRDLQKRIDRLVEDMRYDRLLISRKSAERQLADLRQQLAALK
jgi:predicted transcriptional regulator